MHQTMFLVIFNASLLLTWLLLRRYFSRSSTTVPVVPGLPLLGNVIALGRGGVAFITQCRQKVRHLKEKYHSYMRYTTSSAIAPA